MLCGVFRANLYITHPRSQSSSFTNTHASLTHGGWGVSPLLTHLTWLPPAAFTQYKRARQSSLSQRFFQDMADDGSDLSKQNQKQVRIADPVHGVESSHDEQPDPPPKRRRFSLHCPEPVFPDSPSSSDDDEDDDDTASEGEEVGRDD